MNVKAYSFSKADIAASFKQDLQCIQKIRSNILQMRHTATKKTIGQLCKSVHVFYEKHLLM